MPAVAPIAMALQNVTRVMPCGTLAFPTYAAKPPRLPTLGQAAYDTNGSL